MQNIRVVIFFISFTLIFLLNSCIDRSKRLQVNDSLGIQIPDNSKEIEYYEVHRLPNYKRPYFKFIKFNTDSIGLNEIITRTNLISFKNDFAKSMCLENVDKAFIKNLWDFKSNEDFKKKINWWNPDNGKDILLYASFYRESEVKRIENCYLKEWDGRILLSYNKKESNIYIFIEVYMEDEDESAN